MYACLKRPLKKKDQLSLNSPREHSAILSTFIKLPFVIKIFFLVILLLTLSLLSTGSTQEDVSPHHLSRSHDWKNIDSDVKNQVKQTKNC